jgi:hypothetical protein
MSLSNYRDVARAGSDVNAGFQFEFHCGNCSRTWKSPFTAYRRGQFAGLMYRFAYFLSDQGALFRASNAVAEAGTTRARESALRDALELAEQRYHECPACQKTVCEDCWDARAGSCERCAGAGARAPRDDAGGGAVQRNARRAAGADAEVSAALKCPNCSAPMGGGRFCAECGFDMASTHKSCPGCGTLCTRAARFCTDCGHGF